MGRDINVKQGLTECNNSRSLADAQKHWQMTTYHLVSYRFTMTQVITSGEFDIVKRAYVEKFTSTAGRFLWRVLTDVAKDGPDECRLNKNVPPMFTT